MVICCNSKDAADKVACSEVVGPSRLDAEFKLEVDVGDNCERPLVTHLPPSTVPLEITAPRCFKQHHHPGTTSSYTCVLEHFIFFL